MPWQEEEAQVAVTVQVAAAQVVAVVQAAADVQEAHAPVVLVQLAHGLTMCG